MCTGDVEKQKKVSRKRRKSKKITALGNRSERNLRKVKLENTDEFVLAHIKKMCSIKGLRYRYCPIHKRSNHHLRSWPQRLRQDGVVERVCSHGIGHIDPDDRIRYHSHKCDGCCRKETE